MKNNDNSKLPVNIVVTKCVAAVLCTAVVCGGVFKCTSDYSKAIKETVQVNGTATGIQDDSGTPDVTTQAGADVITDDTTLPADDTMAADSGSGTTASGTTVKQSGGTAVKATTASGKLTKAQIISLFNKAANTAKSSSKSIHQTYCKNSQTSAAELKNPTLKSIANKLISANMGNDKKKTNAVYTTAAEKNANFPVSGETWSSKLTEADVKDAKVSTANGVYTVVIKLVDDTVPNIKKGAGHAGKAFSIVTKDQIVEGAGSIGMSVIKEDSIKLTYKDCVISAKIDAATGKLKSVNYFQDWRLALTAMGIDVVICFGCEEDYIINW